MTYQSLPKAPLLDASANTTCCFFGYADSGTMIATSLQNPALSKCLMAGQDSPLDLTVKKTDVEFSNQDGVLDLSTKKKTSGISLEAPQEFSVIPVVKRLPGKTDQNYQEIDNNYGLTLQGLQELLTQKNRFFAQPSPFSSTSFEMVGFLCSSQSRPVLSADRFWEKPELDGVLECKQASSHFSDLNDSSLALENYGDFNKGTSARHGKSLDIITISSKKDPPRNSPTVDLKIPQVKGMDLSWNLNSNISERYDYTSVTMSCLQTDHSLSRRLRTILPKQSSRDSMGSLFDGGGVSEILGTDADQLTSGPQYPISDPEADPTVSKQSRKKRGRYRKYNSEILEEAISVVMSGKMSVSKAQTIYGIPHSTLEYKVKERLGTLKNPPKKKLKMILRVNKQDSIAAETEPLAAPTATSSILQEEIL